MNGELVGINAFGYKDILTARANFIIVFDEISFIKEAMRKPFNVVDEGAEDLNNKRKNKFFKMNRCWKC